MTKYFDVQLSKQLPEVFQLGFSVHSIWFDSVLDLIPRVVSLEDISVRA
jgi:hypothetical protein